MPTLLDTKEAAEFLRMTPVGVRSLISRDELVPDGRGGRGVALFYQATLEEFVKQRAIEWQRKKREKNGQAVSGSEATEQGSVPSQGRVPVPKDRPSKDTTSPRRSKQRGRSNGHSRKTRARSAARRHEDNAAASTELRAIVAKRKG